MSDGKIHRYHNTENLAVVLLIAFIAIAKMHVSTIGKLIQYIIPVDSLMRNRWKRRKIRADNTCVTEFPKSDR